MVWAFAHVYFKKGRTERSIVGPIFTVAYNYPSGNCQEVFKISMIPFLILILFLWKIYVVYGFKIRFAFEVLIPRGAGNRRGGVRSGLTWRSHVKFSGRHTLKGRNWTERTGNFRNSEGQDDLSPDISRVEFALDVSYRTCSCNPLPQAGCSEAYEVNSARLEGGNWNFPVTLCVS